MQQLLSFVLLALTPVVTLATNTYPIILVHGFGGWGRDELFGYKYWGGLQGDLQEELVALGYTVYTAEVGPFASNWDRACELYAQIKGGQVDYGAKHAAAYGHERYGRNFTGLYPKWGETVNGQVNKIHLVGHSMGGQTIRTLAHMLAKGTSGAPIEETDSTLPLFAGGNDWVHSITTISTPNQGTSLADGFSEIGDTVKSLLVSVLNVVGLAGDDVTLVYDAKLDQWGISAKTSTETLQEYLNRVFSSSIFDSGFKDICLWSLSTSGAAEESTWVETLSNVYYYSYATLDTYVAYNLLLQKISLPNILTMLLPMDPLSVFIGGRYVVNEGFSTDWQPNDGVVNTVSMSKDSVGTSVTYSGSSVLGKWNIMTQLSNLDHLGVIGTTLLTQIKSIYTAHASLLYSLAANSSGRRRLEDTATADETTAATGLTAAITALNSAAASVQTKEDLEKLCSGSLDIYQASYCVNMLANANNSTRRMRFLRG